MGNPLVAQGVLNRVRGTLSVTDTPALTVTASYLGKEGISIRPMGNATDILPTMAGTVQSQVPYQQVEITVHLLRTQSMGASWQSRIASNTDLGEVVVTPDAATFGDFTVYNTAIVTFGDFAVAGMDAGYQLTLSGYIITNNDMWNL
ncbi:hypothetical protein PQD17_gp13 [Pantoea phage PdC23]|uniref:Uncharacterized protein n=1 Tax=Pantoea phage PdC23 TaxID=2894356 RepID=A0AAE8YHH8_9CAUD|nr:hypothetical protein PQD17_gp13 [Pantoea phage PdC23]UGC97726.1 hypothetical protein pdc_013 [Pantoea phage PdC23]